MEEECLYQALCSFIKKALLAFIACLIPVSSFSQQPAFRHFTVADGLESPTVYGCMQDENGYMWFATESGINRYNGRTFKSFSVDNGLADNENFRLFQDHYKRIWFVSFNGKLSYYLDGKIYNEKQKPFLKKIHAKQPMHHIMEDGKGRLWLMYFGNEIVMIDNEKIESYKLNDKMSFSGGPCGFINTDGTPRFHLYNNVYRFDERKQDIVFDRKSPYIFFIQRNCRSQLKSRFGVLKLGIVKLEDNSEKEIVRIPEADVPFYFTSVYCEDDSTLWAGTLESGIELYRYTGDTVRLLARFLENSLVSDIFKDREGNIWICTKDEGIYMLPYTSRALSIYSGTKDCPAENLFTVYNTKDGTTWAGGEHGIVFSFDSSGTVKNVSGWGHRV